MAVKVDCLIVKYHRIVLTAHMLSLLNAVRKYFCSTQLILCASLDNDHSNAPTGMIIGVTVGLVSAIVFFLCLLCIIIVKKKVKKRSPAAEGLQYNPQIPLQPRSFTISPSHQNTSCTEQQVPPPHGQFNIEQHFVGPIDPDDVPSYPPPDYRLFSDQLSLAPDDDDAPPDYDTVVSSATTVPQESVQQEHMN